MSKKTIMITGASGSMGSEVLAQIADYTVANPDKGFKCLVLLRKKPANEKLAAKLTKKYGDIVEVVFGDLSKRADCDKCVAVSDYIFHCAAIIPPTSDHNPKLAESSNFYGTKNLVDSIKESGRAEQVKYVHIGTVAEYGNRDWHHPWGRVGDPLLPSCFDFYAVTKLRAERYLLEADLPCWVILRQSGVLHKNLFKNNMKDGLMFHTCWNVPIEWATAHDSGLLLLNLAKYDAAGELEDKIPGRKFWRNIYNIGNGASCRVTGYDTMASGFGIMGAKVEQFFKPNWCGIRNFHCFWYADSDLLNDYLNFRTETWEDYWKMMTKRNWYFKLGAPFPKGFLSKCTIQPLFKDTNAPKFWVAHNEDGSFTKRINAFYGSIEKFNEIGEDWSKFPLFRKSEIKDENGNVVDYEYRRNIEHADEFKLDHGYDESKPDSELDIEDMRQAAAFRGGKCLSETMVKGDLYTKLEWECHDGHKFMSSPFTILKAGHWCPECCMPAPWNFDELAKHIPFFAQVWYDTHDKDEMNFCPADCYKDMLAHDPKANKK